ncbi:MAG: nucleoside kinase [Kiritimatiellae bacterium]|nr:nucleoside kinase [Kiritimatiellia bacterium]
MNIDELNSLVDSGEIDEFIRVCEARQCKEISKIADDAASRGCIRAVLLAGASSAGKTTTAKRLCTQLRVDGIAALHLSTDDYFVGDKRNPRDENGELDYETVEAVDRERLSQDIAGLLAGDAVKTRRFNFVMHDGYDSDTPTKLPEGGIVVLEGLHALNPSILPGIDDKSKYRLFIEPSTQPEVFVTTRLSSSDARLMRRLVRDHQFRKMDPLETFRMWPKVLAGEKKWIDPFRGLADATFDSSLAYELAVLKPYLSGLLMRVLYRRPDEAKAQLFANLLEAVHATDPTKVPGDSILRETIGSSQLDY